MNLAAVVPVKSYARAKTRLAVPAAARARLCRVMLGEVLGALLAAPAVSDVYVVSADAVALGDAARLGAVPVRDAAEEGVNAAVAAADALIGREGRHDATVVVPQDVPFIGPRDVGYLLRFCGPPSCGLVVPSRRFDGTNALLRMPPRVMGTHYDEDSYVLHIEEARRSAARARLVYARRFAMDIDDMADLEYCLASGLKPGLCDAMRGAVRAGGSGGSGGSR